MPARELNASRHPSIDVESDGSAARTSAGCVGFIDLDGRRRTKGGLDVRSDAAACAASLRSARLRSAALTINATRAFSTKRLPTFESDPVGLCGQAETRKGDPSRHSKNVNSLIYCTASPQPRLQATK